MANKLSALELSKLKSELIQELVPILTEELTPIIEQIVLTKLSNNSNNSNNSKTPRVFKLIKNTQNDSNHVLKLINNIQDDKTKYNMTNFKSNKCNYGVNCMKPSCTRFAVGHHSECYCPFKDKNGCRDEEKCPFSHDPTKKRNTTFYNKINNIFSTHDNETKYKTYCKYDEK